MILHTLRYGTATSWCSKTQCQCGRVYPQDEDQRVLRLEIKDNSTLEKRNEWKPFCFLKVGASACQLGPFFFAFSGFWSGRQFVQAHHPVADGLTYLPSDNHWLWLPTYWWHQAGFWVWPWHLTLCFLDLRFPRTVGFFLLLFLNSHFKYILQGSPALIPNVYILLNIIEWLSNHTRIKHWKFFSLMNSYSRLLLDMENTFKRLLAPLIITADVLVSLSLYWGVVP